MTDNYIWLFGENLATTANDNSFYFWKHIVNIEDDIEKYIVFDKNESTLKVYNKLSDYEKSFVLWKNSIKHFKKFFKADLFFICRSYKDVFPESFLNKKVKLEVKKPIIHLQHGVEGLKKLPLDGRFYKNNLLRVCVYNKSIFNVLKKYNNFKEYQLHNAIYPPRFGEFLRKNDEIEDKNQILWFITRRKYLRSKNKTDTKVFFGYIKSVVQDKEFLNFLKANNLKLKIVLHPYLSEHIFKGISKFINNNFTELVRVDDTDLMTDLASSKLLITDYSSIAYDFSFIKKPVLLYQPDLDVVLEKEDLYYMIEDNEEFRFENSQKYILKTPKDLVSKILLGNYKSAPFLNMPWGSEIDYDYIKEDKHNDDLYDYFSHLQRNKITFLGYNFYGIGGTVNATMALAEGLLEEGCFVELISLKKIKLKHYVPNALNIQYLYWRKETSTNLKLHRFIHGINNRNFNYLVFDPDKVRLHPVVGYSLNKLMKNIKTNTLVSTRESLHLFLNDCVSDKVENKIYFFHTLAPVLDILYPGVIDVLNETTIPKAIFVTESNRLSLKDQYNYENYDSFINLGNSLSSEKILERNEIKAIEKKNRYSAIYLLRISQDRVDDLNNLIDFAIFLKSKDLQNLNIDVYGDGDYVEEFLGALEKNQLLDIIKYRGPTNNPIEEIRTHDFMMDFSLNHSFGMTYIEAVLNGKKVFCMKNPGSIEVLEGIPNSFIESYDWLYEQILNIFNISLTELQKNYDIVSDRYSRKTISKEFLSFLDA